MLYLRVSRFLLAALACLLLCGFRWQVSSRLADEFEAGDETIRAGILQELPERVPSGAEATPSLLRILRSALASSSPAEIDAALRFAATRPMPALAGDLQAHLTAPDGTTRQLAVEAAGSLLGRLPDAERASLESAIVRVLGDDLPELRRSALGALRGSESPTVVLAANQSLDDEAAEVRLAAVRLLGESGRPDVALTLIRHAEDEAAEVRLEILRNLGTLEDPRAFGTLATALGDNDLPVRDAAAYRATAITALGQLRDPRALPLLDETLERHAVLTEAILRTLGRLAQGDDAVALGAQGRLTDLATPSRPARTAELALRIAMTLPPEATPRLAARVVTLVAASPAEERTLRPFLEFLGTRISEESPALCDRLSPVLRAHRRAGVQSRKLHELLSRCGDEENLVALLEAFQETPDEVHLGALSAWVDHFGPRAGVSAALLEAFPRLPLALHAAALTLLGALGEEASLPLLEEHLQSDVPAVRRVVLQALGGFAAPRIAPVLFETLRESEDPVARHLAAVSLGRIADPVQLEALIEALRTPGSFDRHSAQETLVLALPQLPADSPLRQRGIASLRQALESPDARLVARTLRSLNALHLHGVAEAAGALREALDGAPDWERAGLLGALLGDADPIAFRAALEDPGETTGRHAQAISATAALGLGESGEASDAQLLLSIAAPTSPWRLAVAASFALHRLGARGHFPDALHEQLCSLATGSRPIVAANALATLRHVPGACPDLNLRELERRASERENTDALAAFRHLQAIAPDGPALRRLCSAEAPALWRARCSDATEATEPGEALSTFAFDPQGTLLRGRLLGLRFPNGSYLVIGSDANGHLRYPLASAGPPTLHDPLRQTSP